MKQPSPVRLERIDEYRLRIPREGEMLSEGLIYADHTTGKLLKQDNSPQQVANVACLPGLVGKSMAMPDIHWGYGFPIGGVAAFDIDEGVISPGGVGYDINCGVRLLRTTLREDEVKPRIKHLVDRLFSEIPTGVGASRRMAKLTRGQLRMLLQQGAGWVVEQGWGRPADLDRLESDGCLPEANPDALSSRAIERGLDQVGTLGSGNHFGEVGVVEEMYDPETARLFGLEEGMVTFFIHCGSRGLGHQVADDSMKSMRGALTLHGLDLPDPQLVCAPITSKEGEAYLGAMRAAANYAFANRQMITWLARKVFSEIFGRSDEELGLDVVYDVCHNIAKIEEHIFEGEKRKVCVHRKGATRAFPAGHPEIGEVYRASGHPVLIPGDMGRYSYVLVGTRKAMDESWGSTCHGAGRVKSRSKAKKDLKGRHIDRELAEKGIYVRAESRRILAEEASEAYKDVADVVNVVTGAGLVRKVARLRPIGNIKG
ncbi:RtcB family protein [Candidatus Zixiibacteriota bacterium]